MNDSKYYFGLKGIMKDYGRKYLYKGLFFPGIFGSSLTISLLILSNNPLKIITITVYLVIDIIPDILGFVLGGYAILIGFGNARFLKFLTKKAENETRSLYQKISAVFAFSLLSQIFVLIIAVAIKYFIDLKIESLVDENYTFLFNSFISLIFIVLLIYAIWIVKDMVVNIFNFGQLHHFKLSMEDNEKITKENDQKNA